MEFSSAVLANETNANTFANVVDNLDTVNMMLGEDH